MLKPDAVAAWSGLVNSKKLIPRFLSSNLTHSTSEGSKLLKDACWASSTHESANKEIRFFFGDAQLDPLPTSDVAKDYLQFAVFPTLTKALTELARAKPQDPAVSCM